MSADVEEREFSPSSVGARGTAGETKQDKITKWEDKRGLTTDSEGEILRNQTPIVIAGIAEVAPGIFSLHHNEEECPITTKCLE